MQNFFSLLYFLRIIGSLFLVLAVLSSVQILGPTASESVFGELWWFDFTEQTLYLVFGILLLFSSFLSSPIRKAAVVVTCILAACATLLNMQDATIFGARFQAPFDTIFHLTVFLWAFLLIQKDGYKKTS